MQHRALTAGRAAQAAEPALASFLHTSVLVHPSLPKAMSFMLANKLSSRTLLGTQLMRLISDAYRADPVRGQGRATCSPLSALFREIRTFNPGRASGGPGMRVARTARRVYRPCWACSLLDVQPSCMHSWRGESWTFVMTCSLHCLSTCSLADAVHVQACRCVWTASL